MQRYTAKFTGFTSNVVFFDGMTDLAAYARASAARSHAATNERPEFYRASFREACDKCEAGDLSLVAKSDALLAQMEKLTPVADRRAIVSDVVGAFPNVPAFISGQPMAMRRRAYRPDEAAPLTVFVDVFASCGFEPEQIEARGAAVLALVRALSAVRPVQLFVGCTAHEDDRRPGKAFAAVTRIDTQPLDLARAAYALCSATFLRRIMFGALESIGAKQSIFAPDDFDAKKVISPIIDGAALMVPPLVGAPSYSDALAWNNPRKWIMSKLREAGSADYSQAA